MKTWIRTLALGLLLPACSNGDAAYNKALTTNDVEGLRAYVQNYPDGQYVADAKHAVDEILWMRATSDDKAESYQEYLAQAPDGAYTSQAQKLARNRAYEAAEKDPSVEAWTAFLEQFPGDDKKAAHARHRVQVLSYASNIHWQPFTIERANMAGKRKGPEDGHAFTTVFTNEGDKTVRMLRFQVQFWGEGKARPMKESTWYPVVPKGAMAVMSTPADWPPIKAQGGRSATWTLGDIDTPADWDKKPESVKLVLKDLWIDEGDSDSP